MNYYFEIGTLNQLSELTKLAIDSNATYNYRTVSDEIAAGVLGVKEKNFTDGIVRLMKKGGETLGFFSLIDKVRSGEKTVHTLDHLFLHPDFIGKGLGKTLFDEVIRVGREELKWEALVWESDPKAVGFYEKMGAKKIGEAPCLLNEDYKAIIFTLTIT